MSEPMQLVKNDVGVRCWEESAGLHTAHVQHTIIGYTHLSVDL